jgi:protein-S-isoprenylcysteine O-methyltransferase Ste14
MSLGLFAAAAGHPWAIGGAAFNTLVLISVTFMTEKRMLDRPERRAEYERYIRTTSSWIPMPKRADRQHPAKAL